MSHWDESIYYFFFPNTECIIRNLFVRCFGEWFSAYLLLFCLCAVPSLRRLGGVGGTSEPWRANELLQQKFNKQEAMNLEQGFSAK